MSRWVFGLTLAIAVGVTMWGIGCGPTGGGLTVNLSGCPGDTEQGEGFELTATVTDANGDDVTANAVFLYEATTGLTTLSVVTDANKGTITVPANAQLGAYVINATGTVNGTNGSDECRFNVIAGDTGDPCDGVTCDPGEECVEGECVPVDPCDGVTCDPGEECVLGECVDIDLCEGVDCDPGEECVLGECVDIDLCEGVDCDPGEECVLGECVSREPAYAGSQACAVCHSQIFGWFRNSAHPYKVNKIIDDMQPTYPFSDLDGVLEMVSDDDLPLDDGTPDPGPGTDNSLSTPADYSEVSYVIGGFGWKARFMDSDGFIVTGSDTQYNHETEGMVAYHNNEVDKPFNCGNCHTTGWRHTTTEPGDDRNDNRQDDLPGMDGTFAEQGIQCEACHGAGAAHAAAPTKDNIVRIATPRTTADFLSPTMGFGLAVACSECHIRDSEKDYPTYVGGPGRILASGDLIRHHEQYEEMQGINPDDDPDYEPTGPHRNLTCITCHNPHTTTIYQDISEDPAGMDTNCTQCHDAEEYAITSGGMTGLACTDCHMPMITKTAIKHDPVGTGPATGDIMTHIFRIDLTQEKQFTDDGKFAYPWVTGDFACKICHNGEDSFNIDFPNTMTIHN